MECLFNYSTKRWCLIFKRQISQCIHSLLLLCLTPTTYITSSDSSKEPDQRIQAPWEPKGSCHCLLDGRLIVSRSIKGLVSHLYQFIPLEHLPVVSTAVQEPCLPVCVKRPMVDWSCRSHFLEKGLANSAKFPCALFCSSKWEAAITKMSFNTIAAWPEIRTSNCTLKLNTS